MAMIFITGSADGLGQMAARILIGEGHDVVLHARNSKRGEEASRALPGARAVITGDLSVIGETIEVAHRANEAAHRLNGSGRFDAVIHNAGLYLDHKKVMTADGLPMVLAVNSLAPYILTCLLERPRRLIYISSGLHRGGDASLQDLSWTDKHWNASSAYADSKLHDVLLAFAVARKWPDVYSNAVDPGWAATKMGGPGAPDSVEDGASTQAWLAGSTDKEAMVSGKYFHFFKETPCHPAARDSNVQDKLLEELGRLSGIPFNITP